MTQTKEQNPVDLVLCMGEYSLLVAIVSLFHRNVCSELHVTKFLHEFIQTLVSFWGAGMLFLASPYPMPWHQDCYIFPQWNISPQYQGDQWTNANNAYFVSFYVLRLELMPFQQQHLHETPQ